MLFTLLEIHLAQFEKLESTISNFIYWPKFLSRKLGLHLNNSHKSLVNTLEIFLINYLKELNKMSSVCCPGKPSGHSDFKNKGIKDGEMA